MAGANVRRRGTGSPEPSVRGDICRPGELGESTAAASPEPARAPLPPTSDNVSYVRFRPRSFRPCFPAPNRPAPLLTTTAVTVLWALVSADLLTASAREIGRQLDSAVGEWLGERRAAGRTAAEASVPQRAVSQIAAVLRRQPQPAGPLTESHTAPVPLPVPELIQRPAARTRHCPPAAHRRPAWPPALRRSPAPFRPRPLPM